MAERSGNSGLAFIVGGLVVAVGFIAWFAFGDGQAVFMGADSGDSTNVTISTEGGDSGAGDGEAASE